MERGGVDTLACAAYAFAVDAVTAEVTEALRAEQVPSVVLKGPGIATWLYAGDRPRLYGDTDLLVRRADWERVQAILERLGFEDELGPLEHPRMESAAGHAFTRAGDRAAVDLHQTLFGIGAPPDSLWAELVADAVAQPIGGTEVLLPARRARLLHIALHAVQHGGDPAEKPTEDLAQALARAPEETWREARDLSRRLDAEEVFAAGLALLPDGRELAARLALTTAPSRQANLRVGWVPLAEGFRELAEADGIRAKLGILVRELFPAPSFMRWWLPLARRGRLGLGLAYLWRPLWLAYRALPGYRAWRRARTGGDER